MTRAQVALLLSFLLLVGGGAWFLSTRLPDARRAPVPPGKPPPPDTGVPLPPPLGVLEPPAVRWTYSLGGPNRAGGMRAVGAEVSSLGTHLLPTMLERRAAVAWLGDAGKRWWRVAFPVAGGEVAPPPLEAAAPPLTLRVTEADGAPAGNVPVAFYPTSPGPAGWEGHRTDAQGVLVLDDRPPGVLRIRVGGSERAGPTLRVVMGRDREASATLEPPWTVTGRVVAADGGAPVAGARVLGYADEGRSGAPATTAADGSFRWAGRFTEETALVVRAEGYEETAVEPALPDPRGVLLSTVEVRLPKAGEPVRGRLVRAEEETAPWFDVAVEPAVSAVLRDWYGPEAVLGEPRRTLPSEDGTLVVEGVPADVALRASVRGDVVPEDHLLGPGSAERRDLRLSPTPAKPDAAAGTPPAPAPAAGYDATLSGRVVDAAGKGLSGLTVGGRGSQTTTAADGSFTLSGLRGGEAVDLVLAWLDGADAGDAVPGEFAPYHETTARAGGKPVTLVFPKAAAVAFRVVDGSDDRPLSWARVVIEDGDGRLRHDAPVALRDGRGTVASLPPTTSGKMTVLAPGLRGVARVVLDAGRTSDLGDVRATAAGTVEGRVEDRAGKPVAGAEVGMVEDAWIRANPRRAAVAREHAVRRARTDANGAFRIAGLDPGRREAIAAWAPGFAPTAGLVLWVDGKADRLSLVLSKGGEIHVRATEKGGAPVSGASVDLESARHGARWLDLVRRVVLGGAAGSTEDVRRASSLLLHEDPEVPGHYLVHSVEPGPYEVVIARPGYKSIRTTITVPDPLKPIQRMVGRLEWPVELEPE